MEGPRGTKKEEFSDVVRLVNSVFRPKKKNMQDEYRIIFNGRNLPNLRIILENGKPVSHIGMNERNISIYGCRTKIAGIGAVCTDLKYRSKGYASVLFNDCLDKADKDGCDFMFISGDRNLYDRLDCMRVGKICTCTIRKSDIPRFVQKTNISVRQFVKKDLFFMKKAYNKKAVKYIRPDEDWTIGMKCGQVMNRKAVFVALEEKNIFKAYLVINLTKEGESLVAEIAEYAGGSDSIIRAIPSIFRKFRLERIVLNIPFEDTGFIADIKDKNIDVVLRPIPGTVRLVNFTRFMERLKPYFIKKANIMESLKFREENGRFIFELGRERLIIKNRRIMIKIVLGSPDGNQIQVVGSEGLSGLFNDIFPLPFVWPGMNYI